MTHTTHTIPGAGGLTRRQIVSSLMLGGAAWLLAGCEDGSSAGSKSVKFNSLDISGAKYAQDFSLPDMNGQQRSMADFRGKVVAMFFGFVQCPDVCPTTLAEMVQVRELLGADADKLQVLFVTVDPERDTAQILKEYLGNFDPSFLALLPTPEELRTRIAPDFKVYYKKIEGSTPTSYTMDHTAGVLLFDPKGKVRLHSSYGSPAASIAADIQALLAEG